MSYRVLVRTALTLVLVLTSACGGTSVETLAHSRDAGSTESQGMPDGASVADTSPSRAPSRDASPADAGTSDGAEPMGSLPACSWPPATVPPNDGPVVASANRTALICGVGNVNNTYCLSTSATECTGVSIYAGPCENQCSPCTMLCTANEYAIAVGMPEYSQPPPGGYPYTTPTLPTACRAVFSGAIPGPGGGDLFWNYSCCPCE